ncbi:MAG: nicotinate-nucleotide--dimethylbenzimidazole phosphoribosyltransferase [Pseudomonadota bacterium]
MDFFSKTVKAIRPQDEDSREKAKNRLENLTMPHWAMGRLMDLALDLAGISGSMKPAVEKRAVIVMAADHGVVASGVSRYPQEVTNQMVRNFTAGGAVINAMARVARARVVVVDMGINGCMKDLVDQGLVLDKKMGPGTGDITKGPAMTANQARRSMEIGMELALELSQEFDVLATGEMGIGNTTPSSAITAVITGKSADQVTGHGTGIDEFQFRHKVSVIEKIVAVNQPNPKDGIDILAKIGGFEIGGLAGLILGAASQRKPVIVDGFISTAAALIAHCVCPISAEYMISAHRSVERGHKAALEHLGKEPLIDLDLRLGEGTGAALALPLVEASVRILTEVATFEEAAVSTANK